MTARRTLAALGAAALALLLAACMLLPGRFDSGLDLHRDGTFAFRYKGELWFMPLAEPGKPAGEETFEPGACTTDAGDERACTDRELADQRSEWEAGAAERKAKRDADAKAARAMLGGIDPTDPRAAQEFADRLSRQAGWKSVVNAGGGKFLVEYAVAGRLDHDFVFPTVERLPLAMPFVSVIRRADGTVRVDAPAFSPNPSGSPLGMLGGLGGLSEVKDKSAPPVKLDGRFTLTTDAAILANNTEEGPKADPAGQGMTLAWKVDASTAAAPTALLRLVP